MTPAAPDERPHEPGAGALWQESWYFDFSRADGLGGYVRLGLWPNQGVAWYWAYVVSPELGLITVRDHEVPLPRSRGPLDAVDLEVRADALWAEVVCETPMEHWGLGLEAFGVRLDDPADAYRGERGERIAVGLDLEWETEAPPYEHAPSAGPAGYTHAGVVHGEILLGPDRFPFRGFGSREHTWGELDWWARPWHRASFQVGEAFVASVAQEPGGGSCDGYVWRLGETLEPVTHVMVESHAGADGVPDAERIVLDHEIEIELERVATAPVLLEAPDGRVAHLPRALCRFTIGEGDTGTGWAEWLQPQ